MMFLLRTLAIFACIALAVGEVVDIRNCPDDVDSCTVHEARIDPCPEALNHRACNIRRRKPSTMSFDFTPNFDADTLEAGVSWVKNNDQELPLITLDREACKYTICPVKANVKQTYAVDVPIESKFPLSSYTIKWVLKAPSGQRCCFTTDIKVVR